MTIIKRCEKEVPGTWADKQLHGSITSSLITLGAACLQSMISVQPNTLQRLMPARSGSMVNIQQTK